MLEENRSRLVDTDSHIPERYIQVRCQNALLRDVVLKEERETVIAW